MQRTQREAQRRQKQVRTESEGESEALQGWRNEDMGKRRIPIFPGGLCFLCASLCVLCVSALNTLRPYFVPPATPRCLRVRISRTA